MIVFDTETTSMVAPEAAPVGQQPRIVEFAAIKLNPFTLEEEGRFQCLINPRIPIPPDASKVHGITDEMVKEEPPFAGRYSDLVDLFLGVETSIVHNSQFDWRVMYWELHRIGKQTMFPYPPRQFCTVELAIKHYNLKTERGDRIRLGALHEHLGLGPHKDAHRAMADVEALVRVVREINKSNNFSWVFNKDFDQ
jgi:DNA polymerase III subunit epsilon